MKMMKNILAWTGTVLLAASLTACAGSSAADANTETETEKETQQETENTAETAEETVSETESTSSHADTLVAYFSATGTTKGVAEKIASLTGADMYEILAAEPYTAEDLNYSDPNTRATKEQNDKDVRPEIISDELSLEGYTTLYLGFPIWWGEEPRIMDTFVETYDFEGITVIPFCTSGSSPIGRSGTNLEENAKSGTWLNGSRFGANVSEAELQSWIDTLK